MLLGAVWLIGRLCEFVVALYKFAMTHWIVVSLAAASCCMVVGLIMRIYKTYIVGSIGGPVDLGIEEKELNALRKCECGPCGSDCGIDRSENCLNHKRRWIGSSVWSVESEFPEPQSPFSDYMAEPVSFSGKQPARGRKEDVALVSNTALIIIDGNNLVLDDKELRTETLKAVLAALGAKGYRYIVFFDKSIFRRLKEEFHDQNGIDYIREGEKRGAFYITPSHAEADGQILQLADREGGSHVVSRDCFRDYEKIYPWIKGSRNLCRVHGWNLVPTTDGVRVLIAGFHHLDIVVPN